MPLLAAMGAVLAAWAGAAALSFGIGLALDRALHREPPDAERALLSFWSGFAALLWALSLWSLFEPITPVTAASAGVAGTAGLAVTRRRWLPLAASLRHHPLTLALFALCSLALANWALRADQHYDTGLYLLGGMEWARAHAVLPGLGQLHGRFAFNNVHLLYAALFDAGPFAGWAPHLVNGSLIVALLAPCLSCGRRLVRGEGDATDAFGLAMIVPAAILARFYLVSLSSDLPATVLAMLVAWRSFRLLVRQAGPERGELVVLTLLAGAAVMVKLSTLVFVGLCWTLAVGRTLAARRGAAALPALRSAAAAALLLAALLAPWLARGVVLSGYPLYPSRLVSLPVEWRIDPQRVKREAEGITAWARVPGVPRDLTLEGPYWIESWARRHLRLTLRPSFPLPLAICVVGLLAAAASGSLGRTKRGQRGLWLLVPAAGGAALWFQVAPDPRFGMFVFWSAAATGVGVGAAAWGGAGARTAAAGLIGLAVLAGAQPWVRALPEGGPSAQPAVATRRFETNSGLLLHVPVKGDQCWSAPLPCTPYPHRSLRLRRAGDPASGFLRGPETRAEALRRTRIAARSSTPPEP